jgi:hypothetical protein
MAKKKDTPARRVKQRHDPAIFAPPPLVKGARGDALENLRLVARGRTFPIAEHVEGDTPWEMGMDQTGTVTVPVRDPTDSLLDILKDENNLQQDGVRCSVNGIVYVVDGFEHDDGLYTLTLVDEVSWRLQQYHSFRAASRGTSTRFGFIQSFVDEASRKPLAKMRSFIPEIDDVQRIKPSKKAS